MSNMDFHREAVGGLWDVMGQLQLNFLVKNNLKPNDKLLDIACGSFRAGRLFIEYLEDSNYYGIDQDSNLVEQGRKREINHLLEKKPNLLINDQFEFHKFGIKFDFMIAQSLWTHLDLNTIIKCLININKSLKQNGKCFVTFFENGNILELDKIKQVEGLYSYIDSDPFHYSFDTLKNLVQQVGMKATYIGDWHHPRNQKIMLITHCNDRC